VVDKLTASDGAFNDYFGFSVSISGTLALVGAYLNDVGPNQDQGSAYLFDCSSFPCSQVDRFNGDYFGWSVSISDSFALVGASQADIGGNTSQGSAYLFDCSSPPCSQIAKPNANDGDVGDFFGSSVSIAGPLAIVGAYADDIGDNSNQGSAYLFDCTSLALRYTSLLLLMELLFRTLVVQSRSLNHLLLWGRMEITLSQDQPTSLVSFSFFLFLFCYLIFRRKITFFL